MTLIDIGWAADYVHTHKYQSSVVSTPYWAREFYDWSVI